MNKKPIKIYHVMLDDQFVSEHTSWRAAAHACDVLSVMYAEESISIVQASEPKYPIPIFPPAESVSK